MTTETLDAKVSRLMALADDIVDSAGFDGFEAALRKELSAAAVLGEPVGKLQYDYEGGHIHYKIDLANEDTPDGALLYTTPQPAIAQPIKAVQITIDALRRAAKEIRDGYFNGWGNTCEDAATLLEHLSATPQPAIAAVSAVPPTEWLVPIKPTPAMIEAGCGVDAARDVEIRRYWEAMCLAAQQPPSAADTCRKCAGQMRPGKAIAQTFSAGMPDFPGDTHGMTISPGGPGKLVDCLKCEACGWSVTGAAS